MSNVLCLIVMILMVITGCGKRDKVILIDHTDRISSLEERVHLIEILNKVQDQRLYVLENTVLDLQIQINDNNDNLLDLLAQEEQARIDGDLLLASQLTSAINNQQFVNFLVQMGLLSINANLNFMLNRINILTARVNNHQGRIEDLEGEVSNLQSDMSSLASQVGDNSDAILALQNASSDLLGRVVDLEGNVEDLNERLDEEGVRVLKCNSAASTERILEINGKHYAVMNRVTKIDVQVVTGQSSVTINIPKLCMKGDNTMLPNNSGNCPNPNSGWVTVGGSSQVIPSFTTGSQSIVSDVKMALELLGVGNYITTDGAAACNFSINSDGSTSNLISAQ